MQFYWWVKLAIIGKSKTVGVHLGVNIIFFFLKKQKKYFNNRNL